MTTAARPTFNPAQGGSQKNEGNLAFHSVQYSSQDLPSHKKIKHRYEFAVFLGFILDCLIILWWILLCQQAIRPGHRRGDAQAWFPWGAWAARAETQTVQERLQRKRQNLICICHSDQFYMYSGNSVCICCFKMKTDKFRIVILLLICMSSVNWLIELM